ncbi:Exopolyphosphatase [Ostreococcus tauri]|uniref:Exopolyphosphatase n=1 Tax=Ostreococcus tauri TaxID=70448 RepID=A0A1Y5IL86_OSTTA|nr:Exopolyphosphatase [Ostreococcus tauri]
MAPASSDGALEGLDAYLRRAREAFLRDPSSVTCALGNEACDLDSVASALAVGYARAMTTSAIVTPIAQCLRRDLALRPDVVRALDAVGVSVESLTCAEDVEAAGEARTPREVILVDHNAITVRVVPKSWETRVVEIIDHHDDAGAHGDAAVRTIELVGSCSSLVYRDVVAPTRRDDIARQVARLLLGAIVLDTRLLDASTTRASAVDFEAAKALREALGWDEREMGDEYETLSLARHDQSSFSCAQLLAKDYKQWTFGRHEVGVASFGVRFQDLVARQDTTSIDVECAAFICERGIDVLFMMSSFEDVDANGAFARQIAATTSPSCALDANELLTELGTHTRMSSLAIRDPPNALRSARAQLDRALHDLEREHGSRDASTSSLDRERIATAANRLRAVLTDDVTPSQPPEQKVRRAKTSDARAFDFAARPSRAIALKVAYLGWPYRGFASQGPEATTPTVEWTLFEALAKTRLVAAAADVFKTASYARCGRTDRGVSGLGQIVTLQVRSNGASDPREELDYVGLLNRALPSDVRALGWAPVDEELNARFDCKWRQYKYFFEKTTALDLEAMGEAARAFEGVHDFRNFCRMDAENVKSFTRRVLECTIEEAGDGKLMYINVRGTAFLWHQVRNMASVLFMVGLGHEPPSVVERLLDLERTPRKPQYPMAPEESLLLWRSGYDESRLDVERMHISDGALSQLEAHVASQMHSQRVRAAIHEETWAYVARARQRANEAAGASDTTDLARELAAVTCAGNVSVSKARHQRLCDRPTEATYDERVARNNARATPQI